jgi:hypothetical protein
MKPQGRARVWLRAIAIYPGAQIARATLPVGNPIYSQNKLPRRACMCRNTHKIDTSARLATVFLSMEFPGFSYRLMPTSQAVCRLTRFESLEFFADWADLMGVFPQHAVELST